MLSKLFVILSTICHKPSKDIKLVNFNLPKAELDAVRSLFRNKELINEKTHKGNTVVLLNRTDFISKMQLILPDIEKFKKIQIDGIYLMIQFTWKIKLMNFSKKVKEKQEISDKVSNKLYPTVSKPGILYSLCKIHESIVDGALPFCPIFSAIGTSTYKLTKFFVPLLEPKTYNQYTIKDSFSFCEELKHFNTNFVMVSFDVESLVTNIPLQETFDLCVQKPFEDKNYIDSLSKGSFSEMVTVTMTDSFISLDNEYHRQYDGVAKGSPLGPNFANIFYVYTKFLGLKNVCLNLDQ